MKTYALCVAVPAAILLSTSIASAQTPEHFTWYCERPILDEIRSPIYCRSDQRDEIEEVGVATPVETPEPIYPHHKDKKHFMKKIFGHFHHPNDMYPSGKKDSYSSGKEDGGRQSSSSYGGSGGHSRSGNVASAVSNSVGGLLGQ